jgi:hypothetical protein
VDALAALHEIDWTAIGAVPDKASGLAGHAGALVLSTANDQSLVARRRPFFLQLAEASANVCSGSGWGSAGLLRPSGNVPRVVYRADDGHLHEIAFNAQVGQWGDFDMTAATGAPAPVGDPQGYFDPSGNVPRVVLPGRRRASARDRLQRAGRPVGRLRHDCRHRGSGTGLGIRRATSTPVGMCRGWSTGQTTGICTRSPFNAQVGQWGDFDMTAATGLRHRLGIRRATSTPVGMCRGWSTGQTTGICTRSPSTRRSASGATST